MLVRHGKKASWQNCDICLIEVWRGYTKRCMTMGYGLHKIAMTLMLGMMLGCASIGIPRKDVLRTADQQYAAAIALLERDPSAGTQALEKFLRDWPQSSLADDAEYRLTLLDLEHGDRAAVKKRLAALVNRYLGSDSAQSARLLLAKLEKEDGNLEKAYRAALRLDVSLLPSDERRSAALFVADLARGRVDLEQELMWLERARGLSRDDKQVAEVDQLFLVSLGAAHDLALLENVSKSVGSNPMHAQIRLRQLEVALAQRQREDAQRVIESLARQKLAPTEAEEFARLQTLFYGAQSTELVPSYEALAATPPKSRLGASGTLGVALPLSGDSAALGAASLRGVQLAIQNFVEESGGRSAIQLEVRDTRSDAQAAAAIVQEFARDSRVKAIIGPLLTRETRAAAPAAQATEIPLLSLSFREDLVRDFSYAFRFGVTSRAQVESLADYAVNVRGLRRFAILYPYDDYGKGLRALFWQAIEERGGEIVGVSSYDANANDFADPIRSLAGYTLLTDDERYLLHRRSALMQRAKRLRPAAARALHEQARAITLPNGQPLPPIVDFDAVFIADGHEKVTLIAPQLEYHEIENVVLLGANGWNHPDLLQLARRNVEGAVFTEGFFASSEVPVVKSFVESYRTAYGIEPDLWAAQAFDAVNLLLQELTPSGITRTQLRDALFRIEAYPGASGVMTIRRDGNADKRPFLLTVKDGQIQAALPTAEPAALDAPSPEASEPTEREVRTQ